MLECYYTLKYPPSYFYDVTLSKSTVLNSLLTFILFKVAGKQESEDMQIMLA